MALKADNFVYEKCLSEAGRASIKPKEMGVLVKRLGEKTDERSWRFAFEGIAWQGYGQMMAKQKKKIEESPPPNHVMRDLVKRFNYMNAKDNILPLISS